MIEENFHSYLSILGLVKLLLVMHFVADKTYYQLFVIVGTLMHPTQLTQLFLYSIALLTATKTEMSQQSYFNFEMRRLVYFLRHFYLFLRKSLYQFNVFTISQKLKNARRISNRLQSYQELVTYETLCSRFLCCNVLEIINFSSVVSY